MSAFIMKPRKSDKDQRSGVVVVLAALLLVVIFGMAAMAIDVGYMMLVKTQLQVAADAGALAGGNVLHLTRNEIMDISEEYAIRNFAGGRSIKGEEVKVEIGIWDDKSATFSPSGGLGNAVRVTTFRSGEGLFFARVIGSDAFDTQASAIAMANPKDIAFVIDLSGSMNDDTEPAWATTTISEEFGPLGYGDVGADLMQDFYQDFNFGAFPGVSEYVGQPLGVKKNKWAYAEITKNAGPLAGAHVPDAYRINDGDNEKTRKRKAYSWIIDQQLARIMPDAVPAPSSTANYAYWEKYLDYVLLSVKIKAPPPPKPPKDDDKDDGGGKKTPKPKKPKKPKDTGPKPPTIGRWSPVENSSAALLAGLALSDSPFCRSLMGVSLFGLSSSSKPGSPPIDRGWLPPSQDGDRIHRFNNPNKFSFPKANSSLPKKLRNWLGYLTYSQFMVDHGRNLKPVNGLLTPLSYDSPECPLHSEDTAGGRFDFPPRTQPMHAVRRSVIAAIEHIRKVSEVVPSEESKHRLAIITFDVKEKAEIHQPLTTDYRTAMQSVTTLQAVGDKGRSTTTDEGFKLAAEHLASSDKGGKARPDSDRIIVLLTDGIPNDFTDDPAEIDDYFTENVSDDSYGGGYYWLDSSLMNIKKLADEGIESYPVGVGLGTDYAFMDRAARLGGTDGDDGLSPRGSGNPAEYERILTEIFKKIVATPTARLVE